MNLIARGMLAAVFILVCYAESTAQQQFSLSGKIFNGATGEPVENALLAVAEERTRVRSAADGSFTITVPAAGSYTIIIASETLKTVKTTVQIDGAVVRDFFMNPPVALGGLMVTGKRDIQKVARYTMTVQELKEVPASFGDSISALTSLPGVIRTTGGLFGPLVIRGGDFVGNNYFIDDIPILDPMHFGGLHSVINNSLMADIDLYASAFPAQFGSASAAVISINTVDNVQKFGGYTDLGLISASALIQAPIFRDSRGELHFAGPDDVFKEGDTMNAGYAIASGRVGYLSVFVPTIYKIITGNTISSVPEYWDYQYKMKYAFNSRHSLTLLLFGNSDYFTFIEKNELDPSQDPYFQGIEAKYDKQTHSQGIYYTWQPADSVTNKLIAYGSLMQSYQYFNLPAEGVGDAFKDFNVTSRPYVFGLKDKFKAGIIKNLLELRVGAQYNLYYFRAFGKTLTISNQTGAFDPGSDAFQPYPIDFTAINQTVGGYIETKLTIAGLTFLPGFRSDYLTRSGEVTYDPRGLLSYEFPTKTTVSIAGGKYSYFFQTNPMIFDQAPHITKIGRDLRSEKAIHRVAGIEQALGLWALKLESFYNDFYDIPLYYFHYKENGDASMGTNSGKIRAYGIEVMLRKDILENQNGFYGWINYTWTHSRYRSGLPTEDGVGDPRNLAGDAYGDQWVNYQYEQQHALKLVTGYKFGRSTLGAKFQLYSSLPYTPIVGGTQDTTYPGSGERWLPDYGRSYTRHFPIDHRLDIRYSYKNTKAWGYITWYIEIINIYNHRPESELKWDYRYDYQAGKNPHIIVNEDALTIIPNFGVEVKF